MTLAPTKKKRLGILGDWTDPIAQLIEDQPGQQGTTFVPLVDAVSAAGQADEVVVLGFSDALAHLPGLVALNLPCQVVLRRRGATQDEATWRAGLKLFAECLKLTDWPNLTLVALNEEAAEELSAMIEQDVEVMEPIPEIDAERPRVAIRRGEEVLTFAVETSDGRRETRRAWLDSYNWVRLRRLAVLYAADEDDPEMADLVAYANGTGAPLAPAMPTQPTVLAVVPNGVGLGHVTRMMAIAKALNQSHNARVVFWSYSRSAEILQAAGFEVILRQNAVHLKAHPPSWRHWETLEISQMIAMLGADMVTYDGSSFDRFIVEALRVPGCGRCGVLWVRRGMLRPETDAGLLEAEQYCDLVLEPGDLAVEMDKGPTRNRTAQHRGFSQLYVSPPVTLKPFLPAYTRRQAKRKLGLNWRRHCLVSLGGAFGDWDILKSLIFDAARRHGVRMIWAQSPLAPPLDNPDPNTTIRKFYPVSRYLAAFDGVITATGYNSYHELMIGNRSPVLFAPTNFVRMDDQVARATYAGDNEWAYVVYSDRVHEQAATIERFMQDVRNGEPNTKRPQVDWNTEGISTEVPKIFERYSKGGPI